MSRRIKPVVAIYEDSKGGSKYLKFDTSKDETDEEGDDVIDIEHTDNESDGSDETYVPTDEEIESEAEAEEESGEVTEESEEGRSPKEEKQRKRKPKKKN